MRDDPSSRQVPSRTVVLAGPAATGKSTLGVLLARRLGLPFIDVDEIAWPYYAEAGWDLDRLVARVHAVGRVAAEREWEPARAHTVERVLAEHPGTVIALGAGHTSYSDLDCASRVRTALDAASDVVLLLPHPGPERSVAVLRERSVASKNTDWVADGHDFLAEWVADPLNHEVATITVYTEGLDPEETVGEVVRL
ncbi:shikimate kinase [Antribacter gilvus]|uniref:shikimate kinase n=1 Tax=Antribacter gilvus TaxID=2304675 RepID=UPI0013DFF713|nr:shikimate kinase [Antribacter gilvus]